MRKPLFTTALIICILTTTLVSNVFADTSSIRQLTLEEAQQMALANNVQYKLQDSYISDELQNYYDVQDSNTKASSKATNSFSTYFSKTINAEVSSDSAANSVIASRLDKVNLKRTSDYNVQIAFIDIKKAQYVMEDKKNDIASKLKDLEAAKAKYTMGYMTSDSLKQYQKAYDDSITAQSVALNDLQETCQTLNKLLGRALNDYNFQIVYDISPVDISTIDLDKIKAANIANKKDLFALQQNVELAKRKYDLTKEKYDHFVNDLKISPTRDNIDTTMSNAERDYENARTSFEDKIKELDISLNNTYNAMNNSNDAIIRLTRDLEDLKSNLEKSKIKYQLGLISKNAYEQQELSLKVSQNKLNSAVADMNMQYASLMLYVSPEVASK